MSKDNNYRLMENCRLFELALAQLYITYSTIFPAEYDKWRAFAVEETMHAKWLTTIKNYVEDEIISFKLTSLTIQSTNQAIRYIKDKIEIARNDKVTLQDALIIALQIEDSIVEKSFFKTFNFSNKEAENIRRYITKETIGHRERFARWLASVQTGQIKAKAA
jgi:hypothetical protein